jgi:Bifunctional DNA primase/polymerase, N-terminal/Family of unknown function (DUF5906)
MPTPQSEFAILLARGGLPVFPCEVNGKLPVIKNFPNKATTDLKQIEAWWNGKKKNIAISTGHPYEGGILTVVDVDVKNNKKGDLTLLRLEMKGFEFPPTFEVRTPTNGRHLYYRAPIALRQGTDTLGQGIDTRCLGGYVLAPGSEIDGRSYEVVNRSRIALAPPWLIEKLGGVRERTDVKSASLPNIDPNKAAQRASQWLSTYAPTATEGHGGDAETFKVAAHLKDLGCSFDQALELLIPWNERCSPPWTLEELETKVRNAFKYGREPGGIAAPEAVFPPVDPHGDTPPDDPENKPHPFEKLNQSFSFVFAGGTGNILWETTGPDGGFDFHLMNKQSFLDMHAANKMQIGDKTKPTAQLWMEWPKRRSFDGLVFEPGVEVEKRWFNMWRGFAVQPADTPDHPMVERWKEHLFENICNREKTLADWLTCWFAHLIQRPFEKPLVATVFRGGKGVGKNALVERVSKLLGSHAMTTARRRYLVSNFTKHLQYSLLFILDEAFWSGDKEAEGVVKDLVTGAKHQIEPKGRESYTVRNLTRVAIIGNEDWLVPASADERRWAVFDVGTGHQQDRPYFTEMRVGLDEQGGAAHLLRYLMDYPITQDVNAAPNTEGLTAQKLSSLEPVPQWWYDTLAAGTIAGGDWGGEWPDMIATNRLRDALRRWVGNRNIKGRLPNDVNFGKLLHQMAPGFEKKKLGSRLAEGDTSYAYFKAPLEKLRAEFERYIGGSISWTE